MRHKKEMLERGSVGHFSYGGHGKPQQEENIYANA